MNTLALFPLAVIGINKIEIDSEKILNFLKKEEYKLTNPSENGEANCYITKNKDLLDNLSFLKDKINENVKYYIEEIMKYNMNFKISTSWSIKTNPNGHSQKHNHQNSFISGVYYPKGNSDFKITFTKEHDTWLIPVKETNFMNIDYYTFNIVEDNVLILFPSHLYHKIDKNTSNQERYSIAFNVSPSGTLGSDTNRICFA
jgi:uncharacterized protein (TIGR02466 family)